MPQLPTARVSVVAKRIQTLLADKVDDPTFFTPAITRVYYGDQDKLPAVPAVCIEPISKVRSWPPTPSDVTQNTLSVAIYIYHASQDPTSGPEETRYIVDRLAETIEEFLNVNHRQLRDANGNDLVIYSYVVENESGYTYRKGSTYRTARLTWRGLTKTRLTLAQ